MPLPSSPLFSLAFPPLWPRIASLPDLNPGTLANSHGTRSAANTQFQNYVVSQLNLPCFIPHTDPFWCAPIQDYFRCIDAKGEDFPACKQVSTTSASAEQSFHFGLFKKLCSN